MKRSVLILLIVLYLLIFACTFTETENLRQLKIISFGIENPKDQPISVGQKITIFAKANKTKDVSYQWSIDGISLPDNSNKICWQIPEIKRTYDISVTAIDSTSNQQITYSEKLMVGDQYAELVYDGNYKTKIKTHTQVSTKEGTSEQETIIEIEKVDEITNITLTDENGTTNYIIENGNIYQVENSKKIFNNKSEKKLLIQGIMQNLDKSLNNKNLSYENIVDQFITVFGMPIKISDNLYQFSKTIEKSSVSIVVDSKLNRITSMKILDSYSKILTDMNYYYNVENGHINLSKIESKQLSILPDISDQYITVMTFEYSL
ncbi:MAG: hypothetical protein GYA61_05970 [Spirochaetales bacterium]|nr:hypothetical protein [Spirochaetales bacterium]